MRRAMVNLENSLNNQYQLATFAGGCFWGVEHIFSQLEGVIDVVSGYMGGTSENPTYEQICTGKTGHAEVAQVRFDPKIVNYETLLDYFWRMHDPTTLNQQGPDIGTQYRSAIFYHTNEQQIAAIQSRDQFDRSGVFPNKAVTQIVEAQQFWPAEDYHQDFFAKHPERHICHVLRPK